LVSLGGFLGLGDKVVGVPPTALISDDAKKVYRIDISRTAFKAAPEIDLSTGNDVGRSVRVAAAYRHFGQETCFLEEGDLAGRATGAARVNLGYVERAYKIVGLPVENLQGGAVGPVVCSDLYVWKQTRCIVGAQLGKPSMATSPATWQKRFELTTCAAADVEKGIPADSLGVAVVYETTLEGENVFLVIESRAGSLRSQCLKRLQTAKLPPVASLMVSFKAEILADTSSGAVHAACRQQVILAGELRRELRPAMR
jgi:hypothetical protein